MYENKRRNNNEYPKLFVTDRHCISQWFDEKLDSALTFFFITVMLNFKAHNYVSENKHHLEYKKKKTKQKYNFTNC